jgi:hypothetical protein
MSERVSLRLTRADTLRGVLRAATAKFELALVVMLVDHLPYTVVGKGSDFTVSAGTLSR